MPKTPVIFGVFMSFFLFENNLNFTNILEVELLIVLLKLSLIRKLQ